MDSGFWTSLGHAASVDWCEPNYLYSPYVAEWWNTLSSVPIALLGLYGMWQARTLPRRYMFGFFSMAIVGFGSVAFHGTLLKVAQASDELPMILTGLVYVFILRGRHRLYLSIYGALVVIAYFTQTAYFQYFIAAYALILSFLAIGTWQLAFRIDPRPVMQRWFLASVCCYLGGFALLWLPEHVLLACDHPVQSAQLHAIFHLTSAVGSYSWLRLAMAARAFRSEEPSLPLLAA